MAADPPRVTFLLLARDQERFVGEAVAGALAQDYPNLEILLSDHESRDRTFAIMAEAASAYRGPHRIVLHRSTSPLGVLGHAFDALGRATGALIVAAAGDDVSRPERVSRLAARWRETGAAVLWSASERIDEAGRPLGPGPRSTDTFPAMRGHLDRAADYFAGGDVPVLHGAAAAYDRRAVEAVAAPDFPVATEDFFLTMMLALRGARFAFVDEPLILWRRHEAALSRPPSLLRTLEAQEAGIARHSAARMRILRHVEAAATTGTGFRTDWGTPAPVDLARLRADAAFHEALAGWDRLGFAARLAAIARARSRAQRRSLLPRLFGRPVLALLKRLR
ncbi:MAG: glycosyltransferase family 2 protein [Alphaproteobacteria bacterium]|nr:glycosyltransferase family 2 protein [Alphaproteobacteria bacterium]